MLQWCYAFVSEAAFPDEIAESRAIPSSIRIIFDKPAADGHDPEGAMAADVVLKAEDGAGMSVEVISP